MSGSRRPTILVVDDEPQLLKLFSEVLADDYRVLEADSGRAALDVMVDDVDVVLLDRRMPGLSGEEVLDQMREAGYDIPVAMLAKVSKTDAEFADRTSPSIQVRETMKRLQHEDGLFEAGGDGDDETFTRA